MSVPSDMYLTEIKLDERECHFLGKSVNQQSVINFINSMVLTGKFSDPKIEWIEIDDVSNAKLGGQLYSFSISVRISGNSGNN